MCQCDYIWPNDHQKLLRVLRSCHELSVWHIDQATLLHPKTNFCIQKTNEYFFPRLQHLTCVISVRMTRQCSDWTSSAKRKEPDKQQDVNYTAAMKSTLHVGLKLSTVSREECQTAVLESALVCLFTLYNCNWKHSSMHKCTTCTNSHKHVFHSKFIGKRSCVRQSHYAEISAVITVTICHLLW